jgi:hypothetical protein
LERDLGNLAASAAGGLEHLARGASAAAAVSAAATGVGSAAAAAALALTGRSAIRATVRFVRKALRGEELLLTR